MLVGWNQQLHQTEDKHPTAHPGHLYLGCYGNITIGCRYRSCWNNGRGSSIDAFSFLSLHHRKMKEVSVGTGAAEASMLLGKGKGHQNNVT